MNSKEKVMNFRDFVNQREIEVKPDKSIVDCITDNSYAFGDHLFFNKSSSLMAMEEYKRCIELYRRRLLPKLGESNMNTQEGNMKLLMHLSMNVIPNINKGEAPHKKRLEDLAIKTIRELYDVPDSVEIEGLIQNVHNNTEFNPPSSCSEDDNCCDQANVEKMPQDRFEVVKKEAYKRLIMNTLAHGASIHVWKSCHYLIKDALDEINPKLVELYDDYSALITIYLWMLPIETMRRGIESGSVMTQGYNKLSWQDDEEEENEDKFSDDEMEKKYQEFLDSLKQEKDLDLSNEEGENFENEPQIKAVGMNFPVLLHELQKAVIELLISHSIPSDFTEDELKLYYAIADDYRDEPLHYYMGPSLWVKMLELSDKTDVKITSIFMILNEMDYVELSKFCNVLLRDMDQAKEIFLEKSKNSEYDED